MIFSTLRVSEVKQNMGQLVKKLRTEKKITQEELAKQLNLSRITIQNIERGNNFTIDTYLLVLEYFNEMASWHHFVTQKLDQVHSIKSIY